VVGDQGCADTKVGSAQDPLHVAQRDVKFAEPVDDLGGRDLLDGVVAVAGGLVHYSGFQQGALVVATQGSHTQVGQARELSDRQHLRSIEAPPGGESSA